MADDEEPGASDELPEDPLIEQLVPDPTQVPNLIVLVGFLGRSSRPDEEDDGNWRLYLTPTLNDYITFERTALVHYQDLPTGGSMVWLKRDTTVQRTRIESRQLQAEFLQGKMIDNAPMSMPGFPSGSAENGNRVTIDGCPPSVYRC
ncbi:MAG TPA: hypothetical protein VFU22_19525 [Roseiflexaceae bacterium]|nr:hypothetical protein [Roseiflexaceae bacterium]